MESINSSKFYSYLLDILGLIELQWDLECTPLLYAVLHSGSSLSTSWPGSRFLFRLESIIIAQSYAPTKMSEIMGKDAFNEERLPKVEDLYGRCSLISDRCRKRFLQLHYCEHCAAQDKTCWILDTWLSKEGREPHPHIGWIVPGCGSRAMENKVHECQERRIYKRGGF